MIEHYLYILLFFFSLPLSLSSTVRRFLLSLSLRMERSLFNYVSVSLAGEEEEELPEKTVYTRRLCRGYMHACIDVLRPAHSHSATMQKLGDDRLPYQALATRLCSSRTMIHEEEELITFADGSRVQSPDPRNVLSFTFDFSRSSSLA
jgi:hypothetical protein